MKFTYITGRLAEHTNVSAIISAYGRSDLQIVLRGGKWYFERCSSTQLRDVVVDEMMRIFPEYKYLYAIGV